MIELNNLSSGSELVILQEGSKAVYSYQVNGTNQSLSASLKKRYMSGLYIHTPIAAKQRTDILFTQYGAKAAIEQLETAENDDTKFAYIDAISAKNLTTPLQQNVVDVISKLRSDYTQRMSVESFVNKQKPLKENLWLELINAIDGIGSDFELRRLLVTLASEIPNSADVKSALLESSETIGSDYEKFSLVSELAKQHNVFSISELFAASDDIGSDFEAYRVVNDLAPLIKTQADFDALMVFLESIGSDYEMRKAIISLPYQDLDKEQTAKIISLAAVYLGSDYELAQTLSYILRQTPHKAELNNEFDYALASMSSDHEKVKVYKLL